MPSLVPHTRALALFNAALSLVERAAYTCKLTPRSADWADAIQAGRMQLWIAATRFEAERGIPFEGYAWKGVVGSICSMLSSSHDSLWAMDSVAVEQLPSGEDVESIEARIDAKRARISADRLPEMQRIILKASVLEDRNLAEAARHVHVPYTTAQRKLDAALESLRDECVGVTPMHLGH